MKLRGTSEISFSLRSSSASAERLVNAAIPLDVSTLYDASSAVSDDREGRSKKDGTRLNARSSRVRLVKAVRVGGRVSIRFCARCSAVRCGQLNDLGRRYRIFYV